MKQGHVGEMGEDEGHTPQIRRYLQLLYTSPNRLDIQFVGEGALRRRKLPDPADRRFRVNLREITCIMRHIGGVLS